MTDTQSIETTPTESENTQGKMVAAGGILGAIAASSCCVLPLILTVFGISGAWMSSLRSLAPYQPYFVAVTLAMLGYGFYLVYFKPKKACAPGEACARPMNNTFVKSMLWVSTLIVLAVVSFSAWFPIILPYLP